MTGRCAACGAETDRRVYAPVDSVPLAGGGRRMAPPVGLCDACSRAIDGRRLWFPSWCPACDDWRPFGHHHRAGASDGGAPAPLP